MGPYRKSRPTLAVVVIALNVLATPFLAGIARADTLAFNPPGGWAIGKDSRRGNSVTQFVPEGQAVEVWTELLTVEDLARWSAPKAPFLMMHRLKTDMQTRCGTSVFWNVLGQQNDSILYEWKTSNCRNKEPDQHAIVRILYGPSDAWIVTYRGRVKPLGALPPEVRDWWIWWLSNEIEIIVR